MSFGDKSFIILIGFKESTLILILFQERPEKERNKLWFFDFVNYFIVVIYWLIRFIEFNIFNTSTGTLSMNNFFVFINNYGERFFCTFWTSIRSC